MLQPSHMLYQVLHILHSSPSSNFVTMAVMSSSPNRIVRSTARRSSCLWANATLPLDSGSSQPTVTPSPPNHPPPLPPMLPIMPTKPHPRLNLSSSSTNVPSAHLHQLGSKPSTTTNLPHGLASLQTPFNGTSLTPLPRQKAT